MSSIDLSAVRSPRLAGQVLRVPTNFDTWHRGLTVRARFALVYVAGVLIKEVRSEVFEVPPGKYDSVTIDPLSEVTVSGAAAGSPGATYCRYFASVGGRVTPFTLISHSDFGGNGGGVEYVRLQSFVVDPRTSQPLSESTNPMPYEDGVDVRKDGHGDEKWYNVSTFTSTEAKWIVHVAHLELDADMIHNRYEVLLGTGTPASPVVRVRAQVLLGSSIACCCEGSVEVIFATEVLGPITIAKFRQIYPPFYSNNPPYERVLARTTNGSYQLYGFPLSYLSSRCLELNESMRPVDSGNRGMGNIKNEPEIQ